METIKIIRFAGKVLDFVALSFFALVTVMLAVIAVMALAVPIGLLPAMLAMGLVGAVCYRVMATAS